MLALMENLKEIAVRVVKSKGTLAKNFKVFRVYLRLESVQESLKFPKIRSPNLQIFFLELSHDLPRFFKF